MTKIGIIGSGRIGGTLTRRFRELGYHVTVANSRGPESLAELVAETGATAGTVAQAAQDGDVVVIATPLAVVAQLPAALFNDKIVVDANNYYPRRDGQIAAIDAGSTSTRWTAGHLPHARVVKAFNSIEAGRLLRQGQPAGDERRIGLPVAGDDDEAKRIVMNLIDELGFDPVDGGALDDSWRQEPGSLVYAANRNAAGVREGLAEATR